MRTDVIVLSFFATVAIFVGFYLSVRDRKLTREYQAFHSEFETSHSTIDSSFNHKDIVVDGLNWHFVDEGNINGPAVLFLHGYPESWYSWKYVIPFINKNYRLIVIDMKGYGRSDKTDEDYNWHVVAKQTTDFMVKGLNISKFHVVGHDWGTLIGSVLVSDFQQHILGFVRMQVDLVLPPFMQGSNGFYESFKARPQFLFFQTEFVSKFLMQDALWWIDKIYSTRLTSEFKEVDRKYISYELSRPNAHVVYKYFLAKNWDFVTAIHNICINNFSFPVLQLQATEDPTQPVHLFDNIKEKCNPNIELIWIHNASHFSAFDQPEFVGNSINQFLSKHSPLGEENMLSGGTAGAVSTDGNQ